MSVCRTLKLERTILSLESLGSLYSNFDAGAYTPFHTKLAAEAPQRPLRETQNVKIKANRKIEAEAVCRLSVRTARMKKDVAFLCSGAE